MPTTRDTLQPAYDALAKALRIIAAATWTVTGTSSANAEQTLTRAGISGQRHYITAIEVGLSGATASSDISVILKDGSTAKWTEVIGNGAERGERVGITFFNPVELSAGADANLYVSAGGVGCITTANMAGYTAKEVT